MYTIIKKEINMKKLLILGGAILLSACATDGRPLFEDPNYALAPVVSSTPNYKTIYTSQPRQSCRMVETTNDPNNIAGTVVGGAAGGLIGNQFGKGTGKTIATAAGALIGAGVGRTVQDRNKGQSYLKEKCETVYDEVPQKVIDGYNVTYLRNGMRETTKMSYDPGSHVKIRE